MQPTAERQTATHAVTVVNKSNVRTVGAARPYLSLHCVGPQVPTCTRGREVLPQQRCQFCEPHRSWSQSVLLLQVFCAVSHCVSGSHPEARQLRGRCVQGQTHHKAAGRGVCAARKVRVAEGHMSFERSHAPGRRAWGRACVRFERERCSEGSGVQWELLRHEKKCSASTYSVQNVNSCFQLKYAERNNFC